MFFPNIQWIGLCENLQENPIFSGTIYGFLSIFPSTNPVITLIALKTDANKA